MMANNTKSEHRAAVAADMVSLINTFPSFTPLDMRRESNLPEVRLLPPPLPHPILPPINSHSNCPSHHPMPSSLPQQTPQPCAHTRRPPHPQSNGTTPHSS